MQNSKFQKGFTLTELLIVITTLSILSIVGIASFSSYGTTQKLTEAVLDVKNSLQYAKSQTISQINKCPSGQQFLGYKFLACCSGGGCPVCLSTKNYEVDIVCSNGTQFVKGSDLPEDVTIDTIGSTSFSFQFHVLSGNVTGTGMLTLKQGNITKNITVSAEGGIQ